MVKYFLISEDKYHSITLTTFKDGRESFEDALGLKMLSIDDNDILRFEIVNEAKFILARLKYNL